ncbi:MAG: T9SS type A sorting domain-containing protein [Candidatus Marinimicrobia bacterium]|nr:T9SS type A sorting domain-containing protein [Candidatus Neomarinimicrobiota bacterium]
MKKLLMIVFIFSVLCRAEGQPDSTHYYAFDDPGWHLYQRLIYEYPSEFETQQTMLIMGYDEYGEYEWIIAGIQSWIRNEYGDPVSYTVDYSGYGLTHDITNTYEDGKLVEALTSFSGISTIRDTYTWDGDLLVQVFTEVWNGVGWENDSKITHSYSGNKLIQSLTENWDEGDWLYFLRITNTYDGDRLDHWIGEEWIVDDWGNLGKYYLIYDEQGRQKEQHNHDWDGVEFSLASKLVHFYGDGATDIKKNDKIPENFSLTNYPNPFNPSTKICFELPNDEVVTLQIFDMKGILVNTIVSNQKMAAGRHTVEWNATDMNNTKLPSGVYLYSIVTGNFQQTKRCLLIK